MGSLFVWKVFGAEQGQQVEEEQHPDTSALPT